MKILYSITRGALVLLRMHVNAYDIRKCPCKKRMSLRMLANIRECLYTFANAAANVYQYLRMSV